MARTREIKKRMTAVRTIQRITKTMQMIATAKFTYALQRAKATKPYTEKIRQLAGEVAAAAGDVDHPLMKPPAEAVNRELLVVIASDRGLCGAYNGNVLRNALNHLRRVKSKSIEIDLETAGKKAVAFFKFQRMPVTHRHALGDKPSYDEVEKIAERFIAEFTAGKYDAIRVAYMRFVSNTRQTPTVMQLLPLKPEVAPASTADGEKPKKAAGQYEFRPSSQELLNDLLPKSVKVSLFQAFNDAIVSEQIMRMVAMKAATENAKELSKVLKTRYNRARQTQITTELMEIIAGAAALE